MAQPLSDRLRTSLRFLPPPLPAAPSIRLTAHLPSREGDGLTTLHRGNLHGLGPASTPVARHLRRGSSETPDWPRTFWSKPVSTFGLFLVTTFAAIHLGWPYHAPLVPDRRGAGSRDLGSRSGRYPEGYGYVVPRAPHPPVARDARLGRRLLAEQQVLSPPSRRATQFPRHPRVAPER